MVIENRKFLYENIDTQENTRKICQIGVHITMIVSYNYSLYDS